MSTPILVTGAAGFIGFHAALRLLQTGHKVVGIDNLNSYYDVSLKQARLQELYKFCDFAFVQLDISNLEGMKKLWDTKGPFTTVIHLAAQAGLRHSQHDPYAYITSNVMGHLTVLEMCRHTQDFKHLIYASSSSVYNCDKTQASSLNDCVNLPISMYAATKRSDELISTTYSELYGIPQTGLRFFTVYGPWGRPDMAMFIFTKAIFEGKKVPVFNAGNVKRDFTYIDDIIDGIIALLDKIPEKEKKRGPHRILNLGNTQSHSVLDFIALIEKEIGKKADMEFLPMQAGDVEITWADITETTNLIGYKPKVPLAQGIQHFIKWYNQYYST